MVAQSSRPAFRAAAACHRKQQRSLLDGVRHAHACIKAINVELWGGGYDRVACAGCWQGMVLCCMIRVTALLSFDLLVKCSWITASKVSIYRTFGIDFVGISNFRYIQFRYVEVSMYRTLGISNFHYTRYRSMSNFRYTRYRNFDTAYRTERVVLLIIRWRPRVVFPGTERNASSKHRLSKSYWFGYSFNENN